MTEHLIHEHLTSAAGQRLALSQRQPAPDSYALEALDAQPLPGLPTHHEHDQPSDSVTLDQMQRHPRSRGPSSLASDDSDKHNGLSYPGDHRRRYSAADGSASTQTAQLLSMSSLSFEEEPTIPTAGPTASGTGFFELPPQDRRNFLLLVLLYFLQGIPLGLATGSVPFLLKQYLSYGQIGVFSLASYPYSLKLLWSPIVDAVWSPRLGRRKSWILPVQAVSGIGMLYLGSKVERMMTEAGTDNGASVWGFTVWWFMLVFTCATQDIAVDGKLKLKCLQVKGVQEADSEPGWALTLLSQKNLSYASTAQTVGLTGGEFLSYTVFLAFNSPEFANTWIRKTPLPQGLITLGGYLTFWGWAYLTVTVLLAAFKKEEKTRDRDGILDVYKVMGGILKLRNIQLIIVIHLIAKIGFQANDGVTNLKLLDKGFSQEDLALTVLIDFPFELLLGYYAGKWSSSHPPMRLWCGAFIGRLAAAMFAQVTVWAFPVGGVTTWYRLMVIMEHIFSTFMSTIMFVAISAFHAKIADPVIGGTYMTLLAT